VVPLRFRERTPDIPVASAIPSVPSVAGSGSDLKPRRRSWDVALSVH